MTYSPPPALRYGQHFAEALKDTGAEDVRDRDQAQDQGGEAKLWI